MALILAVNPGGTQSGTLARVARELQEHELIGADSCAVAIEALPEHKPALVLLPAAAPSGEPELLNQLRTATRGGIPTMRLPPPTSVNPRALADQIRQALREGSETPAEPPAAPGPSPHLIAAAHAAISWIRARRASWSEGPARPAVPTREPAPVNIGVDEGPTADEAIEPAAPSVIWRAPTTVLDSRESIALWLPRVAVIIAAALLIWALISYWPLR